MPEKSIIEVRTMCHRDCPDTCFVDALVKDGQVISTRGSRGNPITQGFLCPRGAGDPKRVYSKERVLYPHIRSGDEFRRVSWPEAMEYVGSRLSSILANYGNEAVLLYDYLGNQGCLSLQYSQRLWRALGATVTDGALCSTSGHTGIGLHYGLTYGLGFEEVFNCGAVLFWGNNAKVSSPHLWTLALRARKEKHTMLISVDPRKSETAENSDLWINPRPGSDVALFYGIALYLGEHDGIARKFVDEWTIGYVKFREEVNKWTPKDVERATGVPWTRIEELGEILSDKPPAAFMIGLGLNKSTYGAEAARAVSLLPALLGQHRGFHYSDHKGRFIDWEYLNGSKMSSKKSKVVEQVSVGTRLNSGEFKFVFIKGSNPAVTLPDQNVVRAGLSREDTFVVLHDTHWTETAKHADVVLPATTYLEKSDLNFSDHHPYTRLSRKVIEPLGESKDEIHVMHQLAKRINCNESWVFEDPWQALENATKGAFENGHFTDLLNGSTLKLRQKPANEYQTPSGKIELYSQTAHKINANPLPLQLPLDDNEAWFTLLNSSMPKWTHSQFTDVYGLIPKIVWINPSDANNLGARNGDEVTLFNEQGEVTVEAVVTDRISKGVLWSPRPLTGKNGVPLNALSSSNPQTLGAGPRLNSIKAKIRAC